LHPCKTCIRPKSHELNPLIFRENTEEYLHRAHLQRVKWNVKVTIAVQTTGRENCSVLKPAATWSDNR
jgi:hypothetical protein